MAHCFPRIDSLRGLFKDSYLGDEPPCGYPLLGPGYGYVHPQVAVNLVRKKIASGEWVECMIVNPRRWILGRIKAMTTQRYPDARSHP